MATTLQLRKLLSVLTESDQDVVVIGSSALAVQGWDVAPGDLDLMVRPGRAEAIVRTLGLPEDDGRWVDDGPARRLECDTEWGPVDIYQAVSGGIEYDDIVREAVTVMLGKDKLQIKVCSLEHVRDMRAAVGRDSLPADATPPAAKEGTPRVIAIDGPAGAGKSTVTRAVAKGLGFTYLDTGAMYRCVTLAVLGERADPDDSAEIRRIADGAGIAFRDDKVYLDGEDVTDAIRDAQVTMMTSHIAAFPEVREAMIRRQRQLFSEGAYVAEGRDTGTVVAPDAPLKIYLTASPEERARRRAEETGEPFEQVLQAMSERDRLDSQRRLSALRVAEDAVVLDTTGRTVDEVVAEIAALARERGIA